MPTTPESYFRTQPVDPNLGVDPATLARAQGGIPARGQLEAQQMEMAQALRRAETPLSGPNQQASAPAALLRGLGGFMQQRRGKSDLERMREEANALRGILFDAQQAEMDMGRQQQAYGMQRQDDIRRENQEFQLRQAREAAERREALQLLRMHEKDRVASSLGKLMSADQKKRHGGILAKFSRIQDIREQTKGLSDDDLAKINQTLRNTFTEGFSPDMLKNVAEEQLRGFSPETQRFLASIRSLSAEEIHRLFGSQVTAGEKGMAQKIVPLGADMTLDQAMNRLDAMYMAGLSDMRGLEQELAIQNNLQDADLNLSGQFRNFEPWQTTPASEAPPIDQLKAMPRQQLVDYLSGLTDEQRAAIAARLQQ